MQPIQLLFTLTGGQPQELVDRLLAGVPARKEGSIIATARNTTSKTISITVKAKNKTKTKAIIKAMASEGLIFMFFSFKLL